MSDLILYSLVESSTHPNFSSLYKRLGIKENKLTSGRKAMSQIKKKAPDVIVAEFFYGYGNNYAGINISNLDVMLYSLQKYAPACKLLIFVSPAEAKHVPKLNDIFPIYAILQQPVGEANMQKVLEQLSN